MDDILTATEIEHVTGSEAMEDSVEDPGSASDFELDSAELALSMPNRRPQASRYAALNALATREAWPVPIRRRQASRYAALDALATREAWPVQIRSRQASRNAPLDALAIREARPAPYSRPAAADAVATATALAE
jgi:hypothetical protein